MQLQNQPQATTMSHNQQQQQPNSTYAQNRGQNLSIAEMRTLHGQALKEAEAKRTELRLVLSSRYRELVGSSDEVQKMKGISDELHTVVKTIPDLIDKLGQVASGNGSVESEGEDSKREEIKNQVLYIRNELSNLPRLIHRALDEEDPKTASLALVNLFSLIRSQTEEFPLSKILSNNSKYPEMKKEDDVLLHAQIRMVYMHVQTLPSRTTKLARGVLLKAQPKFASKSYGALCALSLLDIKADKNGQQQSSLNVRLMDLYYDTKGKLVHSLLEELMKSTKKDNGIVSAAEANQAEGIMIRIVEVLQYDVILHSYDIFLNKKGFQDNELPDFDPHTVKLKCSNFLAAHIPLIRSRIRSILVNISVTASMLGDIRQTLYDKTSVVSEDKKWDSALDDLVDDRIVSSASFAPASATTLTSLSTSTSATNGDPALSRFSLWSALFSSTFSTLVHSLLSTSFRSIHTDTITTLRQSLSRAPRSNILPHEAYRNTTTISLQLNTALKKLKSDAHDLLVHAEEREESERRLKQSLYVQTCEIMGRLLCETRRLMISSEDEKKGSEDVTKDFIVGRLAYLFKFRLDALGVLLDPDCAPEKSVTGRTTGVITSGGMISVWDLISAFQIADVDDDGVISLDEAMECMSGAFSGTQFNGAEMVRETLLLNSKDNKDGNVSSSGALQQNVTLFELALLSAKGMRHDRVGEHSALGIIQSCLDLIIQKCFDKWVKVILSPYKKELVNNLVGLKDYSSIPKWLSPDNDSLTDISVSPHIIGYILSVCSTMNGAVCPADSLPPIASVSDATSLGITLPKGNPDEGAPFPTLVSIIRNILLSQSIESLTSAFEKIVTLDDLMMNSNSRNEDPKYQRCLNQFLIDVGFVERCYFERNRNSFIVPTMIKDQDKIDDTDDIDELSVESNSLSVEEQLKKLKNDLSSCIVNSDQSAHQDRMRNSQNMFLSSCDLYFSALFGEDQTASSPPEDSYDLFNVTGSVTTIADNLSGTPLLLNPIPSSKRFLLLPVQADRQLNEMQMHGGKYGNNNKDGDIPEPTDEKAAGVGSGFGYFSSMFGGK